MKRFFYPLSSLLLLVLLALPAGSLSAQTAADADHGHATAIGCGTGSFSDADYRAAAANTRLLAPEVYRQSLREARGEKSQPKISADFEITDFFYVINSSGQTPVYDQVLAGLAYDGDLVRIWVDLRDTARVTAAKVQQLATALDDRTAAGSRDPNKGIVRNNQDVYGLPPTPFLVEGKTDFFLTDIRGKLDAQGQVTLGFFSPTDQQPKSQFQYSNEKNLLYVDNNQGLAKLNDLLAIVAHEHQHLLHYAQNVASRTGSTAEGYTFYNEGTSELASILNGYPFRTNAPYLANTNVDLFRYDRTDGTKQEIDYERGMMFSLYLYEQFGETLITNLVKQESAGLTRVNSAMDASGINLSVRNAQDVVKGFAVANYVQTASDAFAMYRYRHHAANTPATRRAAAKKTFDGNAFDLSGTVAIERYGSEFHVYNNAQPMTVTYTSPRQAALMVMYFKNNVLVAVEEKSPGTAHDLGRALGTYDKIVLAFVGIENDRTTINYTVAPLTVGVRENNAVTGGLSISEISPNPARESAAVRYHSGAGTLRLELFDARGERVATPIDGAGSSMGSHEIRLETAALAPGVYMLRLYQDGKIATHPLVVVR